MSKSKSFDWKISLQGLRVVWKALILSVGFVVLSEARADPFRNFDFESFDPAKRILPGWHLGWHVIAPDPTVRINETNITLGLPPGYVDGPLATLIDVSLFPRQGLDGKYALSLAPDQWTLSQRGDVPQDAKFLSWVSLGSLPMELKIDGTVVPVDYFYDSLSFSRGIHAYAAADISAYAGKNVGLELTTQRVPPFLLVPGAPHYSIIDSLTFSPLFPVPEPSTLALWGLGGLALLWSRKKIRK